jgi:uncharacterized protein YqeY
MAKLTERIRAELTEAMKARDTLRLSTLRMLQAGFKNEQIEKGHELSDQEAEAVIRRSVKQHQDSIEQFGKGGRQDLVDKEAAELAILEVYLPGQMSDIETEKLVQDVIAMVGAGSKKDIGRVIKEIMATHRGRVDGKRIQELVSRFLE